MKKIWMVLIMVMILLQGCSGDENIQTEETGENPENVSSEESVVESGADETADITGIPDIPEEIQIVTEKQIIQYDELVNRNIVYKSVDDTHGKTNLQLDIYYPTERLYANNPVLFAFHGGGWVAGTRHDIVADLTPLFDKLRKEGYAIITVQYRYASEVIRYPSPVEDCVAAVEFVKQHSDEYDIDMERCGVIGYSAGAHLAMMTALSFDKFRTGEENVNFGVCVSIAGPTKMDDDSGREYPQSTLYLLDYFFGGTLEEKKEEYEAGSPYFYLSADTVTSLLFVHGDEDEVVPYEQSVLMNEKARELGIETELFTLNGSGHNFYSALYSTNIVDETAGYIMDNIK